MKIPNYLILGLAGSPSWLPRHAGAHCMACIRTRLEPRPPTRLPLLAPMSAQAARVVATPRPQYDMEINIYCLMTGVVSSNCRIISYYGKRFEVLVKSSC